MDVATIGLIEDKDILLDVVSLALNHLDNENTDIEPGVLDAWQYLARQQLALKDISPASAYPLIELRAR